MSIDLKVTRKKWELHRYLGNPKKIYPQVGPIDAKADTLHVGSENNAIATACVPQLKNVVDIADEMIETINTEHWEWADIELFVSLEKSICELKARIKELRRYSHD